MPDIKQKPKMDRPKILEVSRAPKEAGALLKEQYKSQQSGKRPSEKEPVQYAVNRIEKTAQNSMIFAAKAASGRLKHRKIKDKNYTAPKWEQDYYESKYNESENAPIRWGKQKPSKNDKSQSSYFEGSKGDSKIFSAEGNIRESPASFVRERGRQKLIEDKKQAEIRSRIAVKNAYSAVPVKQKAVDVKTGKALAYKAVPGERLTTPAAAAARQAKKATQQKAQKQMLKQAAIKAKKKAKIAVRQSVQIAKAAARAIAASAKAIIVVGGGPALLAGILLIVLIGAVAASPFGIFFSGEKTGPEAVPISAAVAEINHEFNGKMEEIQKGGSYDNIVINGTAADWPEVLAVFASKVAGAENGEAMDVVTIDRTRIDMLKTVFWDMTEISYTVEVIHFAGSEPDGSDGGTSYILHITITAKTAKEMSDFYGFTRHQESALDELLLERAMLSELAGKLSIISADASEVLKQLPAELSAERRAVIKAACSLVGKVNYFWGGKSLVLGWDSQWGQIQKVWADGSSSTGTWRPFGLDCSGFVDWAFYQASDGKYVIGHGGGTYSQHRYCTAINWGDALPGDLVFYPGDTHVGIVGGRDKNGNLLIIHCASSQNNVVITGASGFTVVVRPVYFS